MCRSIVVASLVLTALPAAAQQAEVTEPLRPRAGVQIAVQPALSGAAAIAQPRAETAAEALQPAISGAAAVAQPSAATAADARSAGATSSLSRLGIAATALTNRNVSVLSSGVLTRVTPDNAGRLVNAASVVVERTGDVVTQRREGNEQRFTLPVTFRQLEQINGTTRELEYAPEVVPQSALRYFGDRRQYVANVRLGVFETNPAGERSLSEPVVLSLTSISLNAIDPEDLQFTQLNRFQEVEVTATNLSASPSLSVRPNFEPQGFDVPLPVGERPAARVSFDRGSILGLGLETATASIQVLNVENPAGLDFQMRIDNGALENDGRVTLDASGKGTIKVRSIGLGSTTLSSRDALFSSVDGDSLAFTMPWMFVAAVVLGGLAGTVATRSSREAWLRGIVIGIVTGIIVFVAYAVGINLLGVTPAATTGEALAFVLAALGAAAGPKILAPKPST